MPAIRKDRGKRVPQIIGGTRLDRRVVYIATGDFDDIVERISYRRPQDQILHPPIPNGGLQNDGAAQAMPDECDARRIDIGAAESIIEDGTRLGNHRIETLAP